MHLREFGLHKVAVFECGVTDEDAPEGAIDELTLVELVIVQGCVEVLIYESFVKLQCRLAITFRSLERPRILRHVQGEPMQQH